MTVEESKRKRPPVGWRRYWQSYGGLPQLRSSRYLRASLVLTVLMAATWTQKGWWDTAVAVLPSLLGFTLGGYALLLGFGDDRFKALLVTVPVRDTTGFMDVSATFMHFILVQAVALLASLLAKALNETPLAWARFVLRSLLDDVPTWLELTGQTVVLSWWFVGYFLFVYSITQLVAVSMAIFRMTGWFNDQVAKRLKREAERAAQAEETEGGSQE